ncbi:protein-L-isoaspartate O-methyltransferase family protein [Methylobacterium variabile]|jgi:protein-L-isoaspartate(D-aspartate) O-methyltransferase|uniref:protein-L-isoaspartate O-methyltransferase family protein n=1 Tax=Methylobacterium variabile TaxID=298794 RepID=UPI00069EEEF3|nr:methyltransferase domain-containing protein [Methylobacterium variabile]
MTRDERTAIARYIYARHVAHAAAPDDAGLRSALEAALAVIPRERFLPPGPWHLARLSGGYTPTPDDDPVYLYQDVPVAIRPERHLNNGQPSFLAGLIARGRPERGMTAVHVGTGAGYYTALLARLVGEAGHVLGIEHDPDLAAFAVDALAGLPQVRIVAGDGAAMPLPPADLVLVNAGAARPAESWLDALTVGGRLILPLTAGPLPGTPITRGAVFLIERRDGEHYAARCLSPTLIYPCAGARDPEAELALARALAAGGQEAVRTLDRTAALPEDRCWLRGPGWCLAYG